MYKGTTPTLYFRINNVEDLSTIEDIWITFRYKDRVFLNKSLSQDNVEIDVDENMVSVELQQDETLTFVEPEINVQMKVKFVDKKVCVSPIFTIPVESPLNPKLMKEKEGDTDEIKSI